jgi:hypothetical protein
MTSIYGPITLDGKSRIWDLWWRGGPTRLIAAGMMVSVSAVGLGLETLEYRLASAGS